ncbi:MAG: hypothetical protein RBS77_06580 [Candidatus Moranbacteria bacterium]|jgi:hypothetical protein|nr:hypothetical protein [Candidatus Moranbacteria bacterium]
MTKMNEEMFTARVLETIDVKFGEIMALKKEGDKTMNYVDSETISASIRAIFRKKLLIVPAQIEATLELSKAILAPSNTERIRLIKKVVGLGGGLGGLAMVIGGIGVALGWGAGVIAAVTAFFTGAAVAGPIGWVVGGVGIAAIAGYFAFSSDEAKNTEKYLDALKNGIKKAMPYVWKENGEKLSEE